MIDWIIVYILLIIGAALQNIIGFGLGLLCAPLLMLFMPELVPVPMILNALFLTCLITFRNFNHIDYKQTGYSIAGGTIGVALASIVMMTVNYGFYRTLFGMMIIVCVILSMVGFKPKVTVISSVLAGQLSGFLGTLTSSGGAPMGLLYQSTERKIIKANLSIFFIYINAAAIIGLSIGGLVNWDHFILFFYSIPALLIGWGLSRKVNKKIDAKLIKQLILVVAFIAGSTLIIF